MTRTNILSTSAEPAFVLVHGALTDASVWNGVTRRLLAAGHQVSAPSLPMRDLEEDASYLADHVERLPGPTVVVGHSWAGAVISHPSIAGSGGVAALVYVAAFQPDQGDSAGALNERFAGSLLTPENVSVVSNPLGGFDLTLRPDRFAEVYAADVEASYAAVMSVSQRPIDPTALGQPLVGEPGWKTVPSWAIVTTSDRSLPPAVLRFMADRAGSHAVEIDSSHAVPVSHPDAVADVLLAAARAVSPETTAAVTTAKG
jgi:pimeloyl-ACP methyl ester carboxylesterase